MGRSLVDIASRRDFFKASMGTLLGFLMARCLPASKKTIKLSQREDHSSRGHLLREKTIENETAVVENAKIIIIGAGISGLSAAYHLKKLGETDIKLLELGDECGGNSQFGKNQHSEYPYGAHYLTLPNPENIPLLAFLEEKGIILGYDKNKNPIYNETDLCHDPEERLLIRGTFQEGLVPSYGLNDKEKSEISRFFKLMDEFREKKDKYGKFYFTIPRSMASAEPELDYLDGLTFEIFLSEQGFQSDYLLWYINYCCRDDFGAGITHVSAWAGINYFAAHRAVAANTDSARVLTWPEGNGRLVKFLKHDVAELLQTACLVKEVSIKDNKVLLNGFDFKNNLHFEWHCESCILAVPTFISARLLHQSLAYPFEDARKLKHSPWLVATVTLTNMPQSRGLDLCWDNVAYKSKSLGYINNRHQELTRHTGSFVISLYLPLDETDDKTSRKALQTANLETWQHMVTSELELMHPGITENIEEIECCVWGHGMILPSVGLSKGQVLKQLAKPIQNRIFFAHTDLSAYSVFEEAFDWGYRSAHLIAQLNA